MVYHACQHLRYRRQRGDMIKVYKILHGIYDIHISAGILELAQESKLTGHSLKLVAHHSKKEKNEEIAF